MGYFVIVAYRPKPGQEARLLELSKEHLPILRREGLATDRPAYLMKCKDGTLVEVFEWTSKAATETAHTNPVVGAMWGRYAQACEVIPLAGLDEAKDMFAGFEPIDL